MDKLAVIALVILMLPVAALVEGAKPQPEQETATFRVWIDGDVSLTSTEQTGNAYYDIVSCTDGWGEDDSWNIKPDGGGYTFELEDAYPATYIIHKDLVGDDGVTYWTEGTEDTACLGFLFHGIESICVRGEGKPYREITGDFWAFAIYWHYDVDDDGDDDRVCLFVETDHDLSSSDEWEYVEPTSTIYFENRPYSLIWYNFEEHKVGKSEKTSQSWKWQDYLRRDIDHNNEWDDKLTFTVTITKLP